ncbi:zinc ABC transporter substrate-binding protein [uncultured Aquincola sp.]|uniref:metal ABC transporter solute-binding protein, Zn/Mn family n=1 Tax=uncultured Aquincola sp. TaxID=886556 RepID=UPI0032B2F0C6
MTLMQALFWQPFAEFDFMRRALVACLALALTCGPLGTLLVLRRMSLVGDAMAHALLPGAAVGYLLAGLSLGAMSAGAFVAALLVALLAGVVARFTPQREDASFAAFYLIALAAGVLLIARQGGSVDLMHVLFGSVLAVDDASLKLVAGVSSVSLLLLALLWRPIVFEACDGLFMRTVSRRSAAVHYLFLALVVGNLVAGFQALGTLMAVGLLMLPATAARFWVRSLEALALLAAGIAAFSAWAGLLLSYHASLPSGPAIVLVAGLVYVLSLALGRHGSLRAAWRPAMPATAGALGGTVLLTVLAVGLAGAPSPAHAQANPQAAARPRVVASFSILADMAREVGGDAVEVSSLVGPGGDAHVYEPTPAAVRQLAAAQLVVVNGLRFEGWLDRLVAASGYRGPVLVATTGIRPRLVYGAPDPHAWHDPANAHVYIENLRVALGRLVPAQAAAIDARAAQYLQRLDAQDQRLRALLAKVPPEQRRAITSHDAFGYLAAAYGISLASVQGWTTAAEPSAADLARLMRQMKAEQTRALFLENTGSPRMMQRVAQDTGAVIGGTLYADALSPPGTVADSYLKLLDHNLTTLIAAWQPPVARTP